MIPIYDNVRGRRLPWVNITIIAINFVVFFYEVSLSHTQIAAGVTELDRFIFRWGSIPACLFDALGRNQDLSPQATHICTDQPESVFTVFSAMFIHGGWLHILGNMLFLFIFGDNVEDAMGHLRYAVFYLLMGVIAAFTYSAVSSGSLTPTIGASGAIAGVMGAYIVLYPRATVTALIFIFPFPLPAFVLIGFWFVAQVFSGFSSLGVNAVGAGAGVAYFAHIGGFIAGIVLVNVFVLGVPRPGIGRGRRPPGGWP
ncbi:MAG: rhomboid family intramembrane serine protease [Dehalococcoidia bacterium]|nr:rhomboid family intramembrane serine protease [Dehalococcoidia bacterium]